MKKIIEFEGREFEVLHEGKVGFIDNIEDMKEFEEEIKSINKK